MTESAALNRFLERFRSIARLLLQPLIDAAETEDQRQTITHVRLTHESCIMRQLSSVLNRIGGVQAETIFWNTVIILIQEKMIDRLEVQGDEGSGM